MTSKKISVRAATYSLYEWLINTHIIPYFNNTPLKEISRSTVQKLINEKSLQLSPINVKKIASIIQNVFEIAIADNLLENNPAKTIIKPKIERNQDINVWTKEEFTHFLDVAKCSRFHIVFLIALTTGMRQGEILGLRWRDVNLDKGLITIVQSLDHSGKKFNATKTKSSIRSIHIVPELVSALIQHKQLLDDEQKKYKSLYQINDLVIPSSHGTPMNPRNINRVFDNLIIKAKLKKIRFHDLRHTHATFSLSIGQNVKIVSERLGHTTTRMTLDTYSHLLPSMQKDSVDQLSNAFFNKND